LISAAGDSLRDVRWPFEVGFEEPQSEWITVQTDETIGHYADWLRVSVRLVRELNYLSRHRDIHVGQRLKAVFSRTTPAEFHRKRLEYHRSIQEDFFTRYSVTGIQQYVIKLGDNIWDICQRDFDVPYWLVQRYNKERDLLRLHPGDNLNLPVVQALKDPEQQESLID
jgi:membrane-bound lytic murein transglycosylase D